MTTGDDDVAKPPPPVPSTPFAEGAAFYDPATYPRTPGEPPDPAPGTWGMQPDGTFKHPQRTPVVDRRTWVRWPGQLTFRDTRTYARNAHEEAFHPIVLNPAQTFQSVYDMGGRRYMHHHFFDGNHMVLDITDPRAVEVIAHVPPDFSRGFPPIGASVVRRSERTGKLLLIAGREVPRYGYMADKWADPGSRELIEQYPGLRGFRISELTSPAEWRLLSETSTSPHHDAGDPVQDGSGAVDLPIYHGDRYLFVAAAPDASFCNQPYRSLLYVNGHVAYDVSDPAAPQRLGTWWAPGSRAGEEQDSPHYRDNPRWNDHTSWFGARQGLALPRPVEQGGTLAFAPMGGLGMFVLDVSDPREMRHVGHLEVPMSVAGNEGDNVDVTQYEETGFVYFNGYPMNLDGYEPEKPIYQVDVSDPEQPRVTRTLPRPAPPAEAPFTDYAQRRGSFGPKRSAPYTSTGTPHGHVIPYGFHNAGLQVYDVSDPENPRIGASFVPPQGRTDTDDISGLVHGVFAEWDRNLIWVFSSCGIHVVSTPLLGTPTFGMPPVPDTGERA